MRVAIMQPTFFPWAGYFSLIKNVDKFVFLDDVEYSHQSWQSRNYFEVAGQPKLISIPVSCSSSSPIVDVQLSNLPRFLKKMERTLSQSYAKSSGKNIIEELFRILRDKKLTNLADFNIEVICFFTKRLDLTSQFIRSSELNVLGSKSEKVNGILRKLSATNYISAPGSRAYMEEYGLDNFCCAVEFFDYRQSQTVSGYEVHGKNLSILHSLMNYSKEGILDAI